MAGTVGPIADISLQITAETAGHVAPRRILRRLERAWVFRVGDSVSLKASIRTALAGLVTAGIMVAGIVLSIAGLVRALPRPG
jgi:hypothetical protein